jgi:hypothetical protein
MKKNTYKVNTSLKQSDGKIISETSNTPLFPYTIYLIPYTFLPIYVLILITISFSTAFAQTSTNLEIFYSLVDSSVNEVIKELPNDKDSVSLELNLGESYSVFNNKIIAALYSSGKNLSVKKQNGKIPAINYVIYLVNTEYDEIFRSGFLGEYFVPRHLILKGSFFIQDENVVYKSFDYSFRDTIRVEEIELIENESFQFTRGKVPAEPFLSGLIEPVIAIGTAALAVILFFTLRSK